MAATHRIIGKGSHWQHLQDSHRFSSAGVHINISAGVHIGRGSYRQGFTSAGVHIGRGSHRQGFTSAGVHIGRGSHRLPTLLPPLSGFPRAPATQPRVCKTQQPVTVGRDLRQSRDLRQHPDRQHPDRHTDTLRGCLTATALQPPTKKGDPKAASLFSFLCRIIVMAGRCTG